MDNYTNFFSYEKTFKNSADKLYDLQWNNSYESSFKAKINNETLPEKIIFLYHTNEMNDKKQEYKIITKLNKIIYQGDIIREVIRKDGNNDLEQNVYMIINEPKIDAVRRAKVRLCNNYLRLKVDNRITDVYAYFLKGTFTIQDGEFVKINDSDLTCMIGTYYKNIVDKFFKESKTRFLINNKAFKIDGIDDITGINKNHGIYTITLKSDVLNPLDDLENGIAYNEDKPSLPEVFVINGKDKITKGIEETFMISPLKTGVSFKLDDWSIENNLAQVVSQSDGKCIVKGLVANEQIILSAYEGINEICNKTIGIVR